MNSIAVDGVLGDAGLRCGVGLTVDEAIKNAEFASDEDLRGAYPMATRVLASEVARLREALRVIAFPRRGTDEELMCDADAIGRYAATFIPDPRARGACDE